MFAKIEIGLRVGSVAVSKCFSVGSFFSMSSRLNKKLRLALFTVRLLSVMLSIFLGPASFGRFSSRIDGRKKRMRSARNKSGVSISIREVGIGIKFHSKMLSY